MPPMHQIASADFGYQVNIRVCDVDLKSMAHSDMSDEMNQKPNGLAVRTKPRIT